MDARTYDCQYDGLMSMGPCFFDTPLFFARANFKGMDRKIRGTVDDDLTYDSPVPDKQSFYIEPVSGRESSNFKIHKLPDSLQHMYLLIN